MSGTGLIDANAGTFDPATATAGSHTITYSYTDANSCSGSDTKVVTVGAPPSVEAGPDAPIWTQVWLVTAFGDGGLAVVFAALLSIREIARSDVPRSITRAKSRLRREARYRARRNRNMIRLRTILHC